MNLEKLDAAIAHIEAHPAKHNQEHWFSRADSGCGTAACLAGTVALLDGWEPTDWLAFNDGTEATASATKDGKVRCVDQIAMDILCVDRSDDYEDGFTDDEYAAQRLFEAVNTLDDIKQIRGELAAEL